MYCLNFDAVTMTESNSELVCAWGVERVAKIPAQASATLVGFVNIGLTFKNYGRWLVPPQARNLHNRATSP